MMVITTMPVETGFLMCRYDPHLDEADINVVSKSEEIHNPFYLELVFIL